MLSWILLSFRSYGHSAVQRQRCGITHWTAIVMDENATSCMDSSKGVSSKTRVLHTTTIANMNSGFGAFLDLALAFYPIIIFWNLQLRLHITVGLMALFGFGVVYAAHAFRSWTLLTLQRAAACAIIKTTELSTLTAASDITFELANLNIWASWVFPLLLWVIWIFGLLTDLCSTEMWVVFIVGCIPTIRPIFVKVLHVVTSSASRTFTTTRGYAAQDDSNMNISRSRAYSQSRKDSSKITTIITKNDSEENILPGQEGIMMTRDIQVQYQHHSSEASTFNDPRKDPDIWKTRYDETV